ncbi:ABC transporter ATP-binding protein [Phyllobacterium endophyticum]|uniref:Histidine/lysine/arginine/ornithine ABC transporter ATP-binding protein n=1 Tax=Phyllobacterium endophyticum TaxID=1149773 RepID=A0A2P7AS48_9HYPH|nr:ATP-binding cassette domain-containing protein [Phyllobacterium endophyticum]PSH56987.1 histidine/lysine/arginine/ornithine ABC transporter ATP-binding protein [Phyllobacterium endophyticum]
MLTQSENSQFQTVPSESRIPLRVKNLKKRFGRLDVLKGISMTAQSGDVISILGSSGSGKSTFLRCLNLLEEPTDGEIWIAGRHVKARGRLGSPREVNALRAKLGMVFQHFNLWSCKTVLENIIEAPIHVLGIAKQEACLRAEELLLKVGLADKRHDYPAHLSGGQQQRAAIARALAMEPEILLFDEPTSALDPELVGEVLKVIRSLADEGRTMLIVTHELAFARQVSNHVVFFHQGQVEEEGHPDELFRRPTSPRFKQFLSAQIGEGCP